VLSASAKDRRDLFVSTGGRIGTVEQNIEKDFWVCWTLGVLFNGLRPGCSPTTFQRRYVALKGLWINRTFLGGHRHYGIPGRYRGTGNG
jgi:hypothetical protein